MKVITNLITILFLGVALRLFLCTAYRCMEIIGARLQVFLYSALDTDKRSASAPARFSQVNIFPGNQQIVDWLAQRESGYFGRKPPIVSNNNLNKCYITSSLNTVQVYKTHRQNLNNITKEFYTVTYVIPNFVFPLLCVSSADVDIWVNGGWDQPNCGISLNPLFFLSLLENLNLTSMMCEF